MLHKTVSSLSFALKSAGTNAKANERDIRYENVVEGSTQLTQDHEANRSRKAVLSIEQKLECRVENKKERSQPIIKSDEYDVKQKQETYLRGCSRDVNTAS